MTQNKKKQDSRRSGTKGKKEEKLEVKEPSYVSYIFVFLLLAIFTLSLYLRIVMPYDSVFRNGVVAFASDDSVYQMRLVENTLYNFPHRIIFDPWSMYPFGSLLHWGPLWTQLIATVSLIAGLGSYNMQTVNAIGAVMPSVFGALVIFPVYYIGKSLNGRTSGLIAAFLIAVIPGQFFSRSTLGFTDNHVAEVLFSTATLAFFILALMSGRKRNIRFNKINLKDKSVIFSILAGVMLAGYQLSWPGAPFFAMIILIFIIFQYIIDDIRGIPTDYLAIATIPMFIIDLIFVLPYFNPGMGFAADKYSWLHVMVPIGGIVMTIALSVISNEIKRRGYERYYYPIALGGFFVLGMLIMKIFIPSMFNAIVYTPRLIFEVHQGGGNTVAEGQSIFSRPGMFWSNFPITGPLQSDGYSVLLILIVLLFIGYRIVRKQKAEDMLLLVWSVIMFLAMYGQNRWAYYFAANAALLVGFAGSYMIGIILKWGGWQWGMGMKKIGMDHILSIIVTAVVIMFFAYPSVVATVTGENGQPPDSRWGGGEPSSIGSSFSEWLETLTWMRDNTPDTGMDYFAVYKAPTNLSATYPYPDTAYGVMSWWDYGHIITYWGHRIPNANPFQGGIGGGSSHAPGASTFLTAKNEEQASDVLDALGINGKPGARYVITNSYMAYDIMSVFGTWNEDYAQNEIYPYHTAIRTRDGMQDVPSMRYYENMAAKLHIFEGNGLKRYRMVHESARNPYNDEQVIKNVYNMLYGGNTPLENSGMVKVFEFVKGANITGRAPANSQVTLTTTIKTNIGRTFQYSQTTTASNGTYVLTVPYSTTGPIAGETNFNTMPEGPYNITAGNITRQVDVGERDVLDGGTVTLDL